MVDADKASFTEELLKHDRVVIEAHLEVANGSYFQPTGFPDIGACVFFDKDGRRRCLVESEQSMANRLEAVCLQPPGTWRAPFHGKLPVVSLVDSSGTVLATNLTEPHRISSSYVLDGKLEGSNSDKDTLQEVLREKLGVSEDGKRWPLGKRAELASVVFALDPAAILHGFQFMQWSAVGLRQQRLLHARMEAVLAGDSDVHYGMVKVDAIEPDANKGKRQEKSNKGQSIAHKERLVPECITAAFEIDLLGLRERRLVNDKVTNDEAEGNGDRGEENRKAQKFLLALALWKVSQFLADQPAFDARTGQVERSLRLRSDCALRCSGIVYRTQSNGAAFSAAMPLAIDDLVRFEKNGNNTQVHPLITPPDFKPLVRSIAGQEGLEIKVRYVPPAAVKPAEPATATADEANEEDDIDQ